MAENQKIVLLRGIKRARKVGKGGGRGSEGGK